MYGLEAVPRVGQRPRVDDRVGVIQVRVLDLGYQRVVQNPGARPVDTTRLAIRALVGNIETARTTLNVEDPTTTYVIVRQYTPGDVVPSVDIHVANDFSESGYLATTLDGKIDRAYPYAS